jgi:hypothetical protein
MIELLNANVVEKRITMVGDLEVTYSICSVWPDGLDLATYDADGNIYMSESYVRADLQRADLTAFHETVETRRKIAGQSHAYAHRRALLEEFLTAKQILGETELKAYVDRRIDGYPSWKFTDEERVTFKSSLYEHLAAAKPPRVKLMEVITRSMM